MPTRRSSHTAAVALIVIGGLFASTSLATIYRTQQTRRELGSIIANTLRNDDLVHRMAHDIDRERLLIDAHTFEQSSNDMTALERQIAATSADFDAAARQYDHEVARVPEAAFPWDVVRGRVAASKPGIVEALALSRANRDVEAHTTMVRLDGQFETMESAFDELTRVSDLEAQAAQSRMAKIQDSAARITGTLALASLVASIFVGLWTLRALRRAENHSIQYTTALETRNQELDAFAGRVAHDLRGPLTTVNLAASRLGQNSPEEAGAAAILKRGVARMEAMIADLLSLSRIAGTVHSGVSDPARVVDEIREELAERLEREGVRMRVDVASTKIRCNESLLRQALWNLADNGVKYRRDGPDSEVVIKGTVTGRMYLLMVSDNGLGMSPDDARHAFEPFFRSAQVRDLTGTGLGLSIVRRIVEASGGTIDVASRPGQGTTFLMQLPLADDGRGLAPASERRVSVFARRA